MQFKKRKSRVLLVGILCVTLCLTGCSSEVSSVSHAKEKKQEDMAEENYTLVGAYDSADQAVLEEINTDEKKMVLMNLQTGRHYTLNYSGTSYIMDKYGSSMTAGQLKQGQIVDVTFLKSNRQIHQLQVSDDAWKYEEISRYDLTGPNDTATIGSAVYSLSSSTRVFSNGRQADLMDIVKGDVLTVSGVGHEIYSIQIDKGHGYVRLKNDAGLQGGWLEIGNEIITKVTSDNMLLAVPEGSYTIRLRTDYETITQDVQIERNQELVLDCSKIKVKEDNDGYVSFHLQPSTATLAIDGEDVGYPEMVKLSYGIHEIEVKASGYQTLLKHISVGTKVAEIYINLEEALEDEEEDEGEYEYEGDNGSRENKFASEEVGLPETSSVKTVSENSTSANTTTAINAVTSNKVYIDTPSEVEVFLDGTYVGLTPMSFTKITGTHTLTLRRYGYVTRSYTIVLHDDGEDITYSFSSLEREKEEEDEDETKIVEIIIEPDDTTEEAEDDQKAETVIEPEDASEESGSDKKEKDTETAEKAVDEQDGSGAGGNPAKKEDKEEKKGEESMTDSDNGTPSQDALKPKEDDITSGE